MAGAPLTNEVPHSRGVGLRWWQLRVSPTRHASRRGMTWGVPPRPRLVVELFGDHPGCIAHLFEEDCGVDGLGEDVKYVTLRSGDGEKISRVADAGDE